MIFLNLFLYFIIYSVIGWIYESILCSITGKKLVNRGFLNGPLCPIYGSGAMVILLVFYGQDTALLPLFLSSMILTSVVEYITSVLLEVFFNAKWWDYTDRPFNIHGRVYLTGALVFATLSVVLIRYIHPFMISIIDGLSSNTVILLSISIGLIFLYDIYITVTHVLQLKTRLSTARQEINRLLKEGAIRMEELKVLLQDRIEDTIIYTDKVKALFEKGRYQNRRLFKAFPQLKPMKNSDIFQKLKNSIIEQRKKYDDKKNQRNNI